ncbi:MAG TPA: WD40 repeat domain-containing protein, partial [Acidimicrobiales bacterium]
VHDEMTLEAYLALGGIAGAIGTRAEEVYGQLTAGEREICRRMFGRLIAISGAATDTRRRVRVSELRAVEAQAIETVVGRFVDARLLALDRDDTSREPTLEVAHEALFREWPRLRAWIADDRQTIAALRHLNAATETWTQTGYDSELYRGARLAGALDLAEHHADRLTPDERAFVDASRALAERESVAQRRQNRRLRLLLSLTGMLLVVALVAGSVAFVKADQAGERAHDAQLARAAADVDRLVAVSRSEGTARDIAALAALEAHRLSPSATTRNALHEAITADPTYRGSLTTSPVLDLASTRSGERVVAAAPTTIDVYDVGTRSQVASWPVPGGAPLAIGDIRLAVSEDASVVAAATPAGTSVYDGATGEVVLTVPGSATTVALSADTTSIAVGRETGVVEVWDLDNVGGPVAQTTHVGGDGTGVAELAWHPDGGTIAIGTSDGDVVLWQIGRDTSVWQIDGERPVAAPADARSRLGPRALFTADGGRLVVATYFAAGTDRSTRQVQEIRVYDMETRTEALELRRPWSEYAAPLLSWAGPDQGMLLAVGGANAALIEVGVSATADGLPNPQIATFAGHPNVRAASALSDDLIAVGTARGIELRSLRSGNVAVRRLAPPTEQQQLLHSGGYGFVFVALDHLGDRVLAQWGGPAHSNPGRAEVLDLTRSGAEWEPFTLADGSTPFFVLPVGVNLLVFNGFESADGPRVATWDSGPTGPAVASIDSAYRGRSPDVSLSGHRLYLGSLEHDLLADTATGGDVLRLPGVDSEKPYTDARFSTDGTLFTRPDGRGGTEVYDATSGAPIPFEHRLEARLFGPRGTWFAVAESSGTVRLHDQVTGEPIGSPMAGHDGLIKNFVPSPDGTRFLTAGVDGTTRVWDVGSTSQVGRTIVAGSATTWWLGWSGDGRFVVVSPTGNADPDLDRIEIWNFDDESWPALACEVAGRNLTQAEWADFGPRTMERRATCEQFPL